MDEAIRDIIDKINSDKENSSDLPKTIEFETGDVPLLFEYGDKKDEPSAEESDGVSSVNNTVESENNSLNETAEAELQTPPGLFKAYVPRFTEVSQTYRMINDPRPRRDGKHPVAKDEEKVAESVKETPVETVDPTAELEERVEDAIIVNMSVPTKDEDADTLNVYKFSEDNKEPIPEKERTVDDERREIKRLINGDEAIVDEEKQGDESAAETPAEQMKSFELPDPDSGINVFDYNEESENRGIYPEGVSEYVLDKNKGLGKEFELPIQRDSIKDRFLDAIIAAKIRIFAIGFFALLLLAFELSVHYELFDYKKIMIFTFSGTIALVDFLLSASVFLLALPEVIWSLSALFKKKIVSDISIVIGFLVLMGYTASMLLLKDYSYPLYGFLFSLMSFFSVLGTLARENADFAAFKLISDNNEKQVLEKKITRELSEENYALDGLVDEYSSRTARIFRAAFVTDFYKRTSKIAENSAHNGLILLLTLSLSVMVSAICYFLVDGILAVPSAFSLVFLLGLPVFFILSHKVPFRDAEKNAITEESAVLGESSYLEFSDVDVICFEDSEIFGIDDVNLKRFMLYGDRDNMESVMRKMCALFSVVGGPLKSIFVNALDNRVRHNPATNTVIESDGLSGEVNGKLILAGSEEYMLRHGIAIPEGASSERKNDTTKIMYAAENNEIYAKFYIRYSFSEEFTMLLPALKEQGITPLIYTSDPNLSNELLRRLTAGADCVRVMRRMIPGTTDEKLHNRVSSGMATVGDKINAINLLLLSKKYKKFSERLNVSEYTAMGLGVAAAIVLSFVGVSAIPVALLGGWHILWGLVLHFSSKRTFLRGKSFSEEKEENQ